MIFTSSLLCATKLMPNIIETKKVIHMKTCTQHPRKLTYDLQESKFNNTQNTNMFLLCASKFQNMKDEIVKPYHGDKPLQTFFFKIKTLFTLNSIPTTNNKLQEINVL